jgi:hypothetical protein
LGKRKGFAAFGHGGDNVVDAAEVLLPHDFGLAADALALAGVVVGVAADDLLGKAGHALGHTLWTLTNQEGSSFSLIYAKKTPLKRKDLEGSDLKMLGHTYVGGISLPGLRRRNAEKRYVVGGYEMGGDHRSASQSHREPRYAVKSG